MWTEPTYCFSYSVGANDTEPEGNINTSLVPSSFACSVGIKPFWSAPTTACRVKECRMEGMSVLLILDVDWAAN